MLIEIFSNIWVLKSLIPKFKGKSESIRPNGNNFLPNELFFFRIYVNMW